MGCPVKNDSWKRLVNYLGNENDAYRIFNAHNQSIPEIPTITEFKSKIRYSNVVYSEPNKARMLFLLDKYNEKTNTSHSLKFSQNTPSSESVKIVMNFMPRSVKSLIPNSGFDTKKSSAEVETKTPKKYSNIFMDEGNQYIVNGELYPSYEDAESSVYESKHDNKDSSKLLRARQIKGSSVKDVLSDIKSKTSQEYSKIVSELFSKFNSNTKVQILIRC